MSERHWKRFVVGPAALVVVAAVAILPGSPAAAAPLPRHTIAFVHGTAYVPSTIFTVDPVTGQRKSIVKGITPAWSPPGTRLAYVNTSTNKIVIRNADGTSTYTGITSDFPGFLGWSPDGTRLAFDRNNQIWVMNSAAPYHPHMIIATTSFFGSWSPDGTKIVFIEFTGIDNLHIANADGTNDVNILPSSTDENGGAWSPDGTRIAFRTERGGQLGIFTVAPDGSDFRLLTAGSVGGNGSWSPDGHQFVYEINLGNGTQLAVVDADGSNPHTITPSGFDAVQPSWGR